MITESYQLGTNCSAVGKLYLLNEKPKNLDTDPLGGSFPKFCRILLKS